MNKIIFLYLVISFSILPKAVADTVSFKDGKEEKGIVVENYHDRIVLSTVDGEKNIKKSDIKDIAYDRQEQNLVKLGDFHHNKNNLLTAYTYYMKAHQLNPDYKEAQDKFIHIRSLLLRRPEKQLMDNITRKQALFKESGKIYETEMKGKMADTIDERFKDATGLVLVSENEMPKVDMVVAGSPAQDSGIKKEDLIFAIWGRLTGYLNLDVIMDMIMASSSPEVMLTVKKRVVIPAAKSGYGSAFDMGFSLDMKEEGINVGWVKEDSQAAGQGLAKGDILTSIGGKPTRYLPLKDATRLINECYSKGSVELEILRDTVLWRKE